MAKSRVLPLLSVGAISGLSASSFSSWEFRRRLAVKCEEDPKVCGFSAKVTRTQYLRVAFIGNSYLYFNDVPRIVQELCRNHQPAQVKDCLRGGSSWKTLLQKGNGMSDKFKTPNALLPDGTHDIGAPTIEALLADPSGWDFIVMGTYSQEAAKLDMRKDGIEALEVLAPFIREAGACPVLMSTPAYRANAKGSASIGDWQDFTYLQSQGFKEYATRLATLSSKDRPPRVAEVNRAFELVHGENIELWRDLFHTDDFHPSALGSFLEACVISCTVLGHMPVLSKEVFEDPSSLWRRARRMLPEPHIGRMPTEDELIYLHGVAARVFNAAELNGYEPHIVS